MHPRAHTSVEPRPDGPVLVIHRRAANPSVAEAALPLPGHSYAQAAEVSRRLNRAWSECGCSLGARCMATGFAAVLTWAAVRHGAFTQAFFERVPLAIGVAFVCAAAGKVAGILTARWRANREVAVLARAIARARGTPAADDILSSFPTRSRTERFILIQPHR